MSRLNLNRFPSTAPSKSKPVCSTMVSGRMDSDMVGASNSGLTALYMKGIGFRIRPMEMEDLFMLMAICMRENGSTTRLMALVFIATKMEHFTRESGMRINSMEADWRNGLMDPCLKEHTLME